MVRDPYGTQFLAQLGAEVIKIEPPHKNGKGGGDTARAVGPHFLEPGESVYFHAFNLNKRSLTLDLNSDDGQAILHKLVSIEPCHRQQSARRFALETGPDLR